MREIGWTPFNTKKLAPDTPTPGAEWAIRSASPYDVPTHFRSSFDEEGGILTIEFRYIADEETVSKEIKPYFVVQLGKRTKRIYAIRFDVHSFERDRSRLATTAEDLILDLPESENRDITRRAIDQQQARLFAFAAA